MSTATKLGVWATILVGLSGIGIYLYRQYSLLMDFCYKISKFQVISFSKNDITFRFFLKFRNQSNTKVDVKGFDVDVFIMGVKVASVQDNTEQTIQKNAVSEIAFNVTFVPSQIKFPAQKLVELIGFYITGQKEKITFQFKGNAKAKVMGVTTPVVPFDVSFNLKELLADDTTPSTCQI